MVLQWHKHETDKWHSAAVKSTDKLSGWLPIKSPASARLHQLRLQDSAIAARQYTAWLQNNIFTSSHAKWHSAAEITLIG